MEYVGEPWHGVVTYIVWLVFVIVIIAIHAGSIKGSGTTPRKALAIGAFLPFWLLWQLFLYTGAMTVMFWTNRWED